MGLRKTIPGLHKRKAFLQGINHMGRAVSLNGDFGGKSPSVANLMVAKGFGDGVEILMFLQRILG